MKKRVLSILLTLCLIVPMIAGTVTQASAAQLVNMTVRGTCDYTEAYQVLKKVNKERAAAGLSALTMDEDLLACAMQRAAEVAVYFSHTRPDGSSCFTVLPQKHLSYCGENIAAGQPSADGVMTDWMNSEGHRENILTKGYKSIGIGCFYQNDGTISWVQLFSGTAAVKITKSGEKTQSIKVKALDDALQVYYDECRVYAGETTYAPLYNVNTEWGYLVTKVRPQWDKAVSKDPSIATVTRNGAITGVKAGETKVTFYLAGESLTIPVTVKKLSKPVITSVANTKNGITVKWDKVKGATGYVVQRKVGSNGEWEKVKTIDSGSTTSCTNTKVDNGKLYQYRVYATIGSGKSNASTAKTMYRLTRPTLSDGTKNIATKKIVVKWNKNTKATGYQVKFVVGSTTKKVKTTNLSKTLSSLTKGSTYKVSVRSYKTVSGNTYYSAYSPYKSVKVAK